MILMNSYFYPYSYFNLYQYHYHYLYHYLYQLEHRLDALKIMVNSQLEVRKSQFGGP
jgi:hypothetical protein